MSKYTPIDKWHGEIRQFDVNELVEGGTTGLDNIPHQQLADSLFHLKKRIEAIEKRGGIVILPDAASIITTDKGNGAGDVTFRDNSPATDGKPVSIEQIIRSGVGCGNVTNTKKTGTVSNGQLTVGFVSPADIAAEDICEVKYVATNTATGETVTKVIQGLNTGSDLKFPKTVIDIIGYKDGDYSASHFDGENTRVYLTNAQNGHEIVVTRTASAVNSVTTGGWGNIASGVVQWGTADIEGFHAKLYTEESYRKTERNMYTMTYIAEDKDDITRKALHLRKMRGASWGTQPRLPSQEDAEIYGFGEAVKLTDDTVDIYFIASNSTKSIAEGKELTISMFSSYSAPNPNGTALPVSRKAGAGDIVRATVQNGIAHFPNIPIPKLSVELLDREELKSINYEIGTPDIPYAGDGTGFEEFDTSSKASICRGRRDYDERYITEQIEGLDL